MQKRALTDVLVKILIIFITTTISIFILYQSFGKFDGTSDSLLKILLKDIVQIVFALFFIIIWVAVGIYSILPPKKRILKLEEFYDFTTSESDKKEIIGDKYLYSFIDGEDRQKVYLYYTNEKTELIIGKSYEVLEKATKIKRILGVSSEIVERSTGESYWLNLYLPSGFGEWHNMLLIIVIYIIGLPFAIGDVLILINIFTHNLNQNELNGNILAFVIASAILTYAIYLLIYDYKKRLSYANKKWSHGWDSNPGPHPYHGCALPTELSRHSVDFTIYGVIFSTN